MFECPACVLRYARAISSDVFAQQRVAQRPGIRTTRHPFRAVVRRRITTAPTTPRDGDASLTTNPTPKIEFSKDDSKKIAIRDERALRLELQYLKDPVKLAEHVQYTLRCNKTEKALDLCRLASKNMRCVVAWNHTIDWLMKHGRANEAIKVYNEMKKRAQFPDSYTYMVLLRGFPQYRTHHGQEIKEEMVSKALSIYTSMSSPTSRVKPNIMHTNAVLRLCSLARDMDALWSVASKIPEHGPGSADYITYTVLLSAIRFGAFGKEEGVSAEQIGQMRQKAVNEGRRIWHDVIQKWRGGEVLIDEELVSEMANLLLISRRMEDWDDILNLVQQTTNIVRKVAPIGSPKRHTQHVPQEEDVQELESPTNVEEDCEGWVPTPASNAFKPVHSLTHDKEGSRRTTSLAWVKVGNSLLTALVSACMQMRTPKTAYAYWDTLVQDHGVKPDLGNFQQLLRLLRLNRNSAKAAATVKEMQSLNIEPRNMTFRIAMAVCTRDWKNNNVMDHADAIIDAMKQQMEVPDMLTIQSYLGLVSHTDDAPRIMATLKKLLAMMQVVGNRIQAGVIGELETGKSTSLDHATAIATFKSMIGAIDNLIKRKLIPSEDVQYWNTQRSQMNSWVGRATNSRAHQHERSGQEHRQKEEFGLAKKLVREKEAAMVAAGLKKPRLEMSKTEWTQRKSRFDKARDTRTNQRPAHLGYEKRIKSGEELVGQEKRGCERSQVGLRTVGSADSLPGWKGMAANRESVSSQKGAWSACNLNRII